MDRNASIWRPHVALITIFSLLSAQCQPPPNEPGGDPTPAGGGDAAIRSVLSAEGVVVDLTGIALAGHWSTKWSQAGSDHFVRGYAEAAWDGTTLGIQQLDDGISGQWNILANWTGTKFEGTWSGIQVASDGTSQNLSGIWTAELRDGGRTLAGTWEKGQWILEKSTLPAPGSLDGTWASGWGQAGADDPAGDNRTWGSARIQWDGTALAIQQTDPGNIEWTLSARWNGDYFVGTWRGGSAETDQSGQWAGEVTEGGTLIHGRWDFGGADSVNPDVIFAAGPWSFDRSVPVDVVQDRLYAESGANTDNVVAAYFDAADGSRGHYMGTRGADGNIDVTHAVFQMPDGGQAVMAFDDSQWPTAIVATGWTIGLSYDAGRTQVTATVHSDGQTNTYTGALDRSDPASVLSAFEAMAGKTYPGAHQYLTNNPTYQIPAKLAAHAKDGDNLGGQLANIGFACASLALTLASIIPASAVVTGGIFVLGLGVVGLALFGIGLGMLLFDWLFPPPVTLYYCSCMNSYFKDRFDCHLDCYVKLSCPTFCTPSHLDSATVDDLRDQGRVNE